MILDGQLVHLRPLRRSDLPALERWIWEAETMRYMVLGRTLPSLERWLVEQMDGWPRHVVRAIWRHPNAAGILMVPDGLMGVIGLYDIDWLARRAELRVMLGEGRNRGGGTESVRLMLDYGFRALDLHRIWLGTAAENRAARKCFEKCGFLQEGMLIQDFLGPDGRRGDNVRYAILKPRWEALVEEAQREAYRAQTQ